MNLLSLDHGNNLVITPEALVIPEFADLWKGDKTPEKRVAKNNLSYIYFLCNYKSVYQSYSTEKRGSVLKRDLGIKVISVNLKVAIKKYEELQSTPILRLLQSAIGATEETSKYFSNVNYAERDMHGKPVYKPKEVTSCLKDIVGVVDSLEKLEERVKKERQSEARIRGGGTSGAFENVGSTLKTA